MPRIAYPALRDTYRAFARGHGASEAEAEVVAGCLTRADLRGYTRQGAALIPYYDQLLRRGVMRFGTTPTAVADGAAFAVLDGHLGVGQVVATHAMETAIAKARNVGVGVVAVRRSGDFAMAGAHALRAADAGLLGIAMSTGQPLVAPYGGREKFFCTNPVALAVPTGDGPPIVVDVASSPFSMGQLVRAARDGLTMDHVAVVEPDGTPSADPSRVVEDPLDRESRLLGALAAGTRKHNGWLLIVEILAAVLAGAYDGEQPGPAGGTQVDPRFSQAFLALDIEQFGVRPGEVAAGAGRLAAALRDVAPARGGDGVQVPGDRADAEERRRRATGVPIRDEEWDLVTAMLRRLEQEPPGGPAAS